MSDEINELWMDKIGKMAQKILSVEFEVFKKEADVKKLTSTIELKAMSEGHKTHTAQRQQADISQDLYEERLALGIKKANLSALKVELKSLEIGFEEWRTKMVNAREEKKRYGA